MVAWKVGIGKYFVGIGASLIALLAGGWLMLAPFAIGFQAGGAWTKATKVDVFTGAGVAAVALLGFLLFAGSLQGELKAAGIIRPKPAPAVPEEAAPAVPETPAAPAQPDVAVGLNGDGDEFDRAVAALAASLAADLVSRRKMTGEQATAPFANGGEA